MLKKTCIFNVGSRGWVLLEVMGSCLFLGVVLMISQTQIKSQWEAIKSEQQVNERRQMAAELDMMRFMLYDPNWLLELDSESNTRILKSHPSQGGGLKSLPASIVMARI